MAELVFLLAGGAVFFLSFVAFDVLRKAFEQYQRRYLARSVRDLSAMFLFLDPGQVLRLNVCALALLSGAGFWIGGWLCAAVAAVAGFFAPDLANALRAGFTLQQAVDQVGREGDPPLRHEFALFGREVKLGVPLDEALASMAKRVGSEDLDLLATSTTIARQLGGNLAELFENLAATIRERFRLQGRIAALTSQGKLQGLVVAALPVGVGVFLDSYRPDLFGSMFQSAFGYALIGAVVVLQTLGFVAIRRLVAIDV